MEVFIKNRLVKIDKESIGILNSRKWYISDNGYVVWRGIDIDGKKKTIRLHRLIINAKDNEIVDHINRNKLDNRLSNLRICTNRENINNSDRVESAKGYYFDNSKKRWIIDSARLGIRSLHMESEQDCIEYIKELKSGGNPVRKNFIKRISTPSRKITDEQVKYIFNEYKKGRTKRSISKDINCHESTIGEIINGNTNYAERVLNGEK